MPTDKLHRLILDGERVREEKRWDEALTIFDRALIEAAQQNAPEEVISIHGHKLIIYKHLFYETENLLFLELFKGEVLSGLNIAEIKKITGRPKALMLVRLGDYHLLKKEYKKSLIPYKEALENLDPNQKGVYGEFLGHFGFGQALSGDPGGFETLKKAYKMVMESKDLRDFHKLIILSGILLRQSQSCAEAGKPDEAKQSLDKAEELAREVKEKYNLPIRLEEVERLRRKFDLYGTV